MQSAPEVPVKVRGALIGRTFMHVVDFITQLEQATVLRIDPTVKELAFNPTYEQLFAPQASIRSIVKHDVKWFLRRY